jgi:hypothetical protein
VLAGDEPGNEIQSPMAQVILGGLLTSTFLNMVLVPALFARFGGGTDSIRTHAGHVDRGIVEGEDVVSGDRRRPGGTP